MLGAKQVESKRRRSLRGTVWWGAVSLMMVASFSVSGNVFTPAKAQPWTEARFSMAPPIAAFGPGFDLHPGGQRFAIAPAVAQSNTGGQRPSTFVLVFNLFDELRRQARR